MKETTNTPATATHRQGRRRRVLRWIAVVLFVLFFGWVAKDALFPFGDKPYIPIPHGDHVHYVPKDRDPDTPLSAFPRQPPKPDERITPRGQVVPVE
jgi:hypothetical protein